MVVNKFSSVHRLEAGCQEHNSRQTQAKFSVLFKVHFFQTCRGQFTSYKRLNFDFFFLQYHHKTHCYDFELVFPG